MDNLTLFGLLAASWMLACYALEDRGPSFVLGFAGTCGLASAYGFLKGTWPFGFVKASWPAVALNRWRLRLARTRAQQAQMG